jgi:hypothetical protein
MQTEDVCSQGGVFEKRDYTGKPFLQREQGGVMALKNTPKDIDQLLAEADDLIRRIDANELNEVHEKHRIEFEKHAQRLKQLRSEVKEKIDRQEEPGSGTYGEGIHEAIVDIMTAMKNLGVQLS